MNIVDRTSKSIVGTIILGTLAGGAFAVGWWFADSRLGNLSEKIAYGFISGGFVSAACVVGGAVGQQLELQRLLQLLNKPEVSESNKKMAKLIATEIASLMEPKDGQE